jgi:hypothetical protein
MKFHENNFDCRLAQGALETCFSVVFLFVWLWFICILNGQHFELKRI